jgi:hypothetical protein
MERRPRLDPRQDPGGTVAADPAFIDAVNAVRLHTDWRPLCGLGPEHVGTRIERMIAKTVLDKAVELHNEDVRKAEKGR